MTKTKLLWHSNAPWSPTGYGQQTGLFCPLLAEHYDLAISSFYGLDGARLFWHEGIPVYPGMGQEYGNSFLVNHARDHMGDPRDGLTVTLLDVWVLSPQVAQQVNMACWTPVDHDPVPERVLGFLQQSGAMPLAMSRFGEELLKAADLEPWYVPHGIDLDVWKPYPRNETRRVIDVPEDIFLVGMVAANKGAPSRKCFQQSLEAFRAFRERHDDAVLYLHTLLDGSISQGEDIMAMLAALDYPEGSVRYGDQYRMLFNPYPPQVMARLMASFDVLLSPSAGEGFGIPVLEAMACGTQAIATDFSAMKETCGAGWLVKWKPRWTYQNSWQATPDVEDIIESLEACYRQSAAEKDSQEAKARTHAQQYAADKVVADHFLPALKEAENRFGLAKRAKRRAKAAA